MPAENRIDASILSKYQTSKLVILERRKTQKQEMLFNYSNLLSKSREISNQRRAAEEESKSVPRINQSDESPPSKIP